ncbi:MAG: hypothetical protein ACTFAL_02445 [Candidatus Electronema sp. V4]|uniref:hypothetical protein n=1 Tax=Candidatus Electronema sp. V4 TaxID=3454756 RepID=UPI0040557F11
MDWKTLVTNEAVSNYLVFGAGLLIGLFVHVTRKHVRNPSVVQLEKQKEISLIELNSDAKDKLKVFYKDKQIRDFHLTVFELRNKSEYTISDIHLKLHLKDTREKQKLYEMLIIDPLEDVRQPPPSISCVIEKTGEHYLSINIPYLNDSKNHKDCLTIRIYSPKPILISRLVGGGKGWAAQFFDRVAFDQNLKRIVKESKSLPELILNAGTASLIRRWRYR